MQRLPLALGAAAVLGAAACSLVLAPDSLSAGGAAGDGGTSGGDDATTSPDGAPLEAGDDTGSGGDGGGRPPAPPFVTTITSSSPSVTAPSGLAGQSHLVVVGGVFWAFLLDDSPPAQTVKTLRSTDFTTWTAGPTITLPATHANEGRNYSVTTKKVGGVDVVHLAVSLHAGPNDRRHVHVRGTFDASGTLTFGAPITVSTVSAGDNGMDPCGPATVVLADDSVVDVAGYDLYTDAGLGNEHAYRSGVDLGASWPGMFTRADLERVPTFVNARALVATADMAVALWEDGTAEPNPDDVHASVWSGTSWSAFQPVFAPSLQRENDWGASALGADVHVVRRRGDDTTYEHAVFAKDATGWAGAPAPASEAGKAGTGVVLLARDGGTTLVAAAIANDAPNTVRLSKLAGGTWSAWSSLTTTTAAREWLSGYVATDGHAVLLWTENGNALAGALVP